MKNKIKSGLFLILMTACVFVSVTNMSACGRKYFLELKSSYHYDKDTGALIKFPSEITFEPEEIVTFENKKTTAVEYKIINVVIPERNTNTGKFSDMVVNIAYTVYNNKLLFPEMPMQYASQNYFNIKNSIDSVILTINNDNAFLVNFTDSAVKKLYNDSDFENYLNALDKETANKLIYAKTIGISPDGKYLLYLTNRNYIKNGSPASLDIYSYDIQTGTETKIMNFDGKEFLCWEKLDINPGASGNFLFRETSISKTDGKRIYSPIKRYSLTQSKEDEFYKIIYDGEILNTYEMIDDQFAYVFQKQEREEHGVKYKDNILYIIDIYTNEIRITNTDKYSTIWHVTISDSKEYLAFFGAYLNVNGIAIPEILTLHIASNDLIPQYEQNEKNYFIDSFEWCPDNVLLVNFQNTIDLYKDLCRLHTITHKNAK